MSEEPAVDEQARQEIQKIAKSIARQHKRLKGVQDYLPGPSEDAPPAVRTLQAVCDEVTLSYLEPAREKLERTATMTEEDLRLRRVSYEITASVAAAAMALMPEEHLRAALTRLATIPPMDWMRMLATLRREQEGEWLERLIVERGGERPK